MKKSIRGLQYRFYIKPGLTGLAQISCGYCDDCEAEIQKAKVDLEYMEDISLYNDSRIMCKTIVHVLQGSGR